MASTLLFVYASVLSNTNSPASAGRHAENVSGRTVSVAQRWQKSGMPNTREGRLVYASPEELTAWVGTQRGQEEPFTSPLKATS